MTKIAGVIFAGGKARRLEGVDKATLMIGKQSCFDRVSRCLLRRVGQLAISLPFDQIDHAALTYNKGYKYPIAPDWPSREANPAVAYAVLGSLAWAAEEGYNAVVTSPVDTPFLMDDYAEHLIASVACGQSAVYKVGTELHGLHALWSVADFEALKHMILNEQILKISKLHDGISSKKIAVSENEFRHFWNINTPDALEAAQKRV